VQRFHVQNFGCRASQADGAAIEAALLGKGFSPTPEASAADLVVLNTCTVTSSADEDVRKAVHRAHRENPEAKILVTGCYAQRAPEELALIPGVTWVVGNSHKIQIPDIVTQLDAPYHGEIHVGDIFAQHGFLSAPVNDASGDRTRPNLKIQDGCNNRCSFCIIPSLRGGSRSMPVETVLREVNHLVATGYREVVLSGINLGRWGTDLNVEGRAPSPVRSSGVRRQVMVFEDLIRLILDHSSIEKLRISSVEPMDWTDSLIRLVAESPRIAKHAHVPMQSGSDAVLRRMHRKYRPWHYREKIERIRAAMPYAAIGADVMVGFPGETDAEFEETRRMIEELPFTYLHVFTFSARPRTPAASMPNQVPVHVARERNRILRELSAEKKLAFMRSFVGREIEAITLNVSGEDANGPWTEALTDNYLKARLLGRHEANRWLTTRVIGLENGELSATVEVPESIGNQVQWSPAQPRSGARIQHEA
jgi:threonylcarbamoyladenosine tRNA methylthiotransferase MtaB